jgi:hypothetical protein
MSRRNYVTANQNNQSLHVSKFTASRSKSNKKLDRMHDFNLQQNVPKDILAKTRFADPTFNSTIRSKYKYKKHHLKPVLK